RRGSCGGWSRSIRGARSPHAPRGGPAGSISVRRPCRRSGLLVVEAGIVEAGIAAAAVIPPAGILAGIGIAGLIEARIGRCRHVAPGILAGGAGLVRPVGAGHRALAGPRIGRLSRPLRRLVVVVDDGLAARAGIAEAAAEPTAPETFAPAM